MLGYCIEGYGCDQALFSGEHCGKCRATVNSTREFVPFPNNRQYKTPKEQFNLNQRLGVTAERPKKNERPKTPQSRRGLESVMYFM